MALSEDQVIAVAKQAIRGKDFLQDAVVSQQWFYSFMKRNQDLVMKRQKFLDIHRALAANPNNFKIWFKMVEDFWADHNKEGILRTEQPLPCQMMNMDKLKFDPRRKFTKKGGKRAKKQ